MRLTLPGLMAADWGRTAFETAVPKSTINSEDELAEELAARFGVRRQAMLFRLINLRLVASP